MPAGKATVWVCIVCGYEHVGEAPPDECPVCAAPADQFEKQASGEAAAAPPAAAPVPGSDLGTYLAEWARPRDDFEEKYARIAALARDEGSEIAPMRTQRTFPDWRSILFRGAQLHRLPLNEDVAVAMRTVIGPGAAHPLELEIPFYVSHMSFGALSREAKIALARGARLMGTATCSGEGGLLPDEREAAGAYIYELGTATFSHREEAVRQADAVEIKIGQAAKPGLGGHLPAGKVTDEIAAIRGIAPGEDSISPGRHAGIDSVEDLKRRVDELREMCGGRPVGIKFTAGHLEADLDCALGAGPDFVTIDTRGGATGAAPVFVKDNVCLPPIFALRRARRHLDEAGSRVTLCITGGFRDAADIAKALALGADAVALATASLIAIGCQQYRICHTGRCPVGIATQDPELRKRFDVDRSVERFVNFYRATREELATLARINGRADVHDLDLSDVMTLSNEIAQNTDIEHA
jgi:glutamate synthase domain-containing protein 2